MGTWKLEVFKMAMYVAFPVGCFYAFNQPDLFEKYVIEKRREIYMANPDSEREVRTIIKDQKEKQQAKFLAEMEK